MDILLSATSAAENPYKDACRRQPPIERIDPARIRLRPGRRMPMSGDLDTGEPFFLYDGPHQAVYRLIRLSPQRTGRESQGWALQQLGQDDGAERDHWHFIGSPRWRNSATALREAPAQIARHIGSQARRRYWANLVADRRKETFATLHRWRTAIRVPGGSGAFLTIHPHAGAFPAHRGCGAQVSECCGQQKAA